MAEYEDAWRKNNICPDSKSVWYTLRLYRGWGLLTQLSCDLLPSHPSCTSHLPTSVVTAYYY